MYLYSLVWNKWSDKKNLFYFTIIYHMHIFTIYILTNGTFLNTRLWFDSHITTAFLLIVSKSFIWKIIIQFTFSETIGNFQIVKFCSNKWFAPIKKTKNFLKFKVKCNPKSISRNILVNIVIFEGADLTESWRWWFRFKYVGLFCRSFQKEIQMRSSTITTSFNET